MKSRRRSIPSQPCPCGDTCLCHKPNPGMSDLIFILIFVLGMGFLGTFGAFVLRGRVMEQPRHIQVNGHDCIVKVINDNCTSTGACQSHEEAICP